VIDQRTGVDGKPYGIGFAFVLHDLATLPQPLDNSRHTVRQLGRSKCRRCRETRLRLFRAWSIAAGLVVGDAMGYF